MMTLHEAILDALDAFGGPLTFDEIARRVAERGTYIRGKDGLPAPPEQVRRRLLSSGNTWCPRRRLPWWCPRPSSGLVR